MKLSRLLTAVAACAVLAAFSAAPSSADDAKKDADKKEASGPVVELRTYTTLEGRLPALHARFRDHTMKLFEKHGMKNIGYWTPVDKKNTLVYLISHKSRDAAKKSWKAFQDDPDWKKARDASEKDGKIVEKVESVYLTATDYSPMK